MIKIAFFDVDGTLLGYGKKNPSKKTVHALNNLQKKGIMLCLATGRSNSALPKFEDIDFDLVMTFNGSLVSNKDQVIFSNPMDKDDTKQIIQNLKVMNRALAISNPEKVLCNGTDPDLEEYFSFARQKVIVSEEFDSLAQNDIYQMMCSSVKEEYEKILENTKNTKITAWWDRAVDIIPANGGKGVAIEAVFDHYGFKKDESIAFGDGHNDIEMLEAVGCGIAMDNAKKEVKERADYICRSVNDDGIYYYLLENGLIDQM